MKFLVTQITYLLSQNQTRGNLKALLKYLLFLLVIILLYATVFRWIMAEVEGQDHSWVTGIYWTLTVMSTLGFGDITFHSDIGRLFSIVVLLSGVILLLIVLPFAFIRFFYAPWLEARIRFRAPRELPPETSGHVIICRNDTVAQVLVQKLKLLGIPYVVIEPDAPKAAHLYERGLAVATGEIDSSTTYEALRADRARLVLANADDATNTNITLTVREVAPKVPIAAIVEQEDSIDLLELAGANHVLPLKQTLGEHLANRVNAEHAHVHVIGYFRDLLIAEFPVHKTPLAGKTLRQTGLRQTFGISVVGVWERGRLLPVHHDTVLSDNSVPVIIGTKGQIAEIEAFLVIYDTNYHPVLLLGSGNVGFAAAVALKKKGVSVHVIDRDASPLRRIAHLVDQVFAGNAADREVLMKAGLAEAPSVLISTNDDAMNIYLSVYCRRLNPELRIVSRVTHERNLEAIHRAGADFVLSYAKLGAAMVSAILQDRELLMLGEGVDLFLAKVPDSLVGKTLGASDIGARTGLNVIAIQKGEEIVTQPRPGMVLEAGAEFVMIGNAEQRQDFNAQFG
ncbi:MAG: NAD-binding protein [Deltaproteobacteria bacterium]|nr:NAD-binding protein [Deltaproteobacteria bacterium]